MKIFHLVIILILFNSFFGCQKEIEQPQIIEKKAATNSNNETKTPLVTFIELGSVHCVPCKQMQPIMKSIEEKYGSQIKVVFYDVNKEKEKSREYGIRLIPTQVFLDANGKEIHRHEGFYPEESIDKFLQSNGLKLLSQGNI